MTAYLDFYERVKDLVKQQNTTVRAVVESCGINYDSYNSCKRYGNLPRSEEAVRIAAALGTTVEFLVTGTDKTPAASELADLKQKIKSLAESL